MAKVKFYYATMRAGKTTDALKCLDIYQRKGWKPLMICGHADNDNDFTGWGERNSRLVSKKFKNFICSDIQRDVIDNPPVKDYGILIVDEVQFFKPEDIMTLFKIADVYNKPVICYGLKTDCYGNLFPASAKLLALADECTCIENLCDICKQDNAVVHARYENGIIDKTYKDPIKGYVREKKAKIDYKSLCRKCFFKEWSR